MPVKSIYKVSIDHVSILDENGKFDNKLGKDLIPMNDVVAMYEHMSVCRAFDMIAFKLQRSGRMGTYPQNWGQEATSTGAAYVMQDKDWLTTSYRENAGLFWRGLPMEYILWHWMGDERGNKIPDHLRILPISIPIGTQPLHAVGLAWAGKYRKEGSVGVTFFGDGGSSEGDVHEAINFATTLEIPVVFCCQNNGWAISTPLERNVKGQTVAQRGLAYGAHCIQCDGNDIFAVVKVMRDAVELARSKNEVTFVEMITYRLGDHTTADDARKYRDPELLAQWTNRDPLRRLRIYLENNQVWDEEKQNDLDARAKTTVSEVVQRAEGIKAPEITDIFNYTFADQPAALQAQRDNLRTSSMGLGLDT